MEYNRRSHPFLMRHKLSAVHDDALLAATILNLKTFARVPRALLMQRLSGTSSLIHVRLDSQCLVYTEINVVHIWCTL